MDVPSHDIDLDAPAAERWRHLAEDADACRRMLTAYVADLSADAVLDRIEPFATLHVPADQLEELRVIAEIVDLPFSEVVLGNLYYDALAFVFGCTAFAIDTDDGPLHARNLDWWSPDHVLSTETVVYRFLRGGRERFSTVSWPGYVGALSGVAPGRFAVTLNAVLSDEPPQLAIPITSLLRQTLDEAADYDDAVARLRDTPVVASALLLVSGVEPGQMCVIERTPTRAAVRAPTDGLVSVTNDYRALDPGGAPRDANVLSETSCDRFDRATERAARERPATADAALEILSDPRVRMTITEQQMVFSARTAACRVRRPY